MTDQRPIMFPGCEYSEHKDWYAATPDWTWTAVHVPQCMRTCMLCGLNIRRASEVRRHLTARHGVKVLSSPHPGRRKVDHPFISAFDPVEHIFRLLQDVCKADVLKILRAGDLEERGHHSEATKQAWKQACGCLPQKHNAALCWEGTAPKEHAVAAAVIESKGTFPRLVTCRTHPEVLLDAQPLTRLTKQPTSSSGTGSLRKSVQYLSSHSSMLSARIHASTSLPSDKLHRDIF